LQPSGTSMQARDDEFVAMHTSPSHSLIIGPGRQARGTSDRARHIAGPNSATLLPADHWQEQAAGRRSQTRASNWHSC